MPIPPYRPRIYMADGHHMSVQASAYHYSFPRETGLDFYTDAEMGFPSFVPESIMEHKECAADNPYTAVYPYTPTEALQAIIDEHGGIDEETTFNPPEKAPIMSEEQRQAIEEQKQRIEKFREENTKERNRDKFFGNFEPE